MIGALITLVFGAVAYLAGMREVRRRLRNRCAHLGATSQRRFEPGYMAALAEIEGEIARAKITVQREFRGSI
jgi:hypothetical protein